MIPALSIGFVVGFVVAVFVGYRIRVARRRDRDERARAAAAIERWKLGPTSPAELAAELDRVNDAAAPAWLPGPRRLVRVEPLDDDERERRRKVGHALLVAAVWPPPSPAPLDDDDAAPPI